LAGGRDARILEVIMTIPNLLSRFIARPSERRMLFLAQCFIALISSVTYYEVLARHAWVQAHQPWIIDQRATVMFVMGLTVLGIALGWQAWEAMRLRRLASISEASMGQRTWMRALLIAWLVQQVGGGIFLAASGVHMPAELVFTGILLLLVAPMLTSSWITRRTERMLVRQRDLALQARMAPHFLYNSLSTLKGQIAQDPDEAQCTADRLASLFRDLMDYTAENAVPLAREVAWVEAYLGLERIRMGERLKVQVDVPEDLEGLNVPPLCLQVLVENAIKHAVAPRKDGGLVAIRAERVREGLRLSVTDPGNGTGGDGSPERGTGQALAILRQRLSKPGDLRLEALSGGGHCASVLVRS
jgi:Histidine kinase